MIGAQAPLILTARMENEAFARFDRLRRLHFPAALNLIPAHLTLFHHLPGEEALAVRSSVDRACRGRASMVLQVTGLRFLGRGVAYSIVSPELAALHGELAGTWNRALTAQDRQGFRPHVTIANKLPPSEARALFERMTAGFTPFTVRVEGLILWRYLGGPWEHVATTPLVTNAGT